jgi:hypothetical protein
MELVDTLLKAENRIRNRVESLFGDSAVQTPLEVRREILEQVEARIATDRGGKVFPFAGIRIHLQPRDRALHDVFKAAFLMDRSMQEDIQEVLRASRARFSRRLQFDLKLEESISAEGAEESGPPFSIEFLSSEDLSGPERPRATLAVLKGITEQNSYPIAKDRLLIGRLGELMDCEGQMVRRNDIVFLDNGDEINSTVGRSHASIYFDRNVSGYRIVDDVSRYGTRILREGRVIEVPSGNPRGTRLKQGDEIYVGRGCMRFEVLGSADSAE